MKCLSKYGPALVATFLLANCATTASAGWNEFWHYFGVGYHRSNAWPDPFNELDAEQVILPFQMMKHNGWKMHNTIGHERFREGDGALLASGQYRVRWIATQAPENRRIVYVLRGRDQQETDARVNAVNETLANIPIHGPKPTVLITDVEPDTAPGDWATKINRDRLEQQPPPRLPKNSINGTAGAIQ